MTRKGIFTREQAWAEALRDPVPIIDHGATVLMLALLLCLLCSTTFAAEPGIPQRPTCTPHAFKCCDELIRESGCIPAYRPPDIREIDPEYRVVRAAWRRG